jgi:uncharacterized protein YceH (UPF0502 family)
VVRLAREPGKRESRYAHLLSGSVEGAAEGIEQYAAEAAIAPRPDRKSLEERLAALEQRVAQLEQQVQGSEQS